MNIKTKVLTIATFLLSTTANAAILTVPVSGTVAVVNDPDNLLATILGITANVGDAFTAAYTVDNSDIAGSVSPGPIYNISSPSFNSFIDFGSNGYISNSGSYRVSILDNYSDPELGPLSADIWSIATATIGSGSDAQGNFLLTYDIYFADLSLTKHVPNNDLYFVDSSAGWDIAGVSIQKWYSDFNPNNTFLLNSTPNVVPVPAAVWLFAGGLLGLLGAARRKRS